MAQIGKLQVYIDARKNEIDILNEALKQINDLGAVNSRHKRTIQSEINKLEELVEALETCPDKEATITIPVGS